MSKIDGLASDGTANAPKRRSRLSRVEVAYLAALRVIVLLVATSAIAWAAWLAASGFYRVVQSPDSIIELPAIVTATDIKQISAEPEDTPTAEDVRADPAWRKFYDEFNRRYYSLYRNKFEVYRQTDDKIVGVDEFDDLFLNSNIRIELIQEEKLDFSQDKSDLNSLLRVMSDVSKDKDILKLLINYKNAKKSPVVRSVRKLRTEYRRGWDSNSTACSDWFYRPYGCAVRRAVTIPYFVNETSLAFPKGTMSHQAIFKSLQENYLKKLEERRNENKNISELQKQEIISGIETGWLDLISSAKLAGVFLLIMFFFLLIAIERHQRVLAERRHGN